MSIVPAGHTEPLPAYFMRDAFDNAVGNNVIGLHCTTGEVRSLDYFMRQEFGEGIPVDPAQLCLVFMRTYPGTFQRPPHFYQLEDSASLTPASQLGAEPGSATVTASKAEVGASRYILEVQAAEFIGGSLTDRFVWSALSPNPHNDFIVTRDRQRLLSGWGQQLRRAFSGQTQAKIQNVADEAARRYPNAVFLQTKHQLEAPPAR